MIAPEFRRIGLVGGVASGKSLAARWFAARGMVVLDADLVAHGLYAPGTLMCQAILDEFGDGVRTADGAIDRKALGTIVFADPARLKRLEEIVHPEVRQELSKRIDSIVDRGGRVVLEMALLARWPEMVARLDRVVGISAPPETRVARLRARNGFSEEEALQRLARQESEMELLRCATDVIVNDGSPHALGEALAALFAKR